MVEQQSSSERAERLPFRITGDQLRAWRRGVDMTQAELGQRIHYSAAVVGKWETGAMRIPHDGELYKRLTAVIASRARDEGERLNVIARECVNLGQALW